MLVIRPQFCRSWAFIGLELSPQSIVHRYMPSLPRSVVNGSKNRFYIPCTFELRTYDAMLTTSIHHLQENDIEVMRDKMTSMRSIWHMAEHKEMIHDTMSLSDST